MMDAMTTNAVVFVPHRTTPAVSAPDATLNEMRCAVTRSRLGWVLVAATGRGIFCIELGDTPPALIDRLRARFPETQLKDGDPACAAWAAQVAAFIEAPRTDLDLPLDIAGSPLQRAVWQTLREIPPGTTASYGEIAKRIGAPSTAQEVAQACAANQFAVAIPCHRVVRSDGRLGGYRWGYGRKRDLLRRETEALACR